MKTKEEELKSILLFCVEKLAEGLGADAVIDDLNEMIEEI